MKDSILKNQILRLKGNFGFKLTLFLALAMAVSLTACEGQKGFKSSDPLKEYQGLQDNTQPYNPRQRAEIAPPPDNTAVTCASIFRLNVENDKGYRFLTFQENKESSYDLVIRSLAGETNYQIVPENLPQGTSFTLVRKEGSRHTFRLKWKPGRGMSHNVSRLRYVSPAVNQRCGTNLSESLNLLVEATNERPTVSAKDLPRGSVEYTSQDVKFKIEIVDPAGSAQLTPILNGFQFNSAAQSSEVEVLSAVSALSCEASGKALAQTKWEFDCVFRATLLAERDLKPLLGSGRTIPVSAVISASSRAGNQLTSFPTQVQFEVSFPKIDPPVPTTPAPSASLNQGLGGLTANIAPPAGGAPRAQAQTETQTQAQTQAQTQTPAEVSRTEVIPQPLPDPRPMSERRAPVRTSRVTTRTARQTNQTGVNR